MDSSLILHHYDFSSFSEKVRLVLGIKIYRGVRSKFRRRCPSQTICHSPEDIGGHPLQIGADVYCDSKRIIEELERRFPEPSIYPGPDRLGQRAFTAALERWTDSILLRTTINYISSAYPEGARFTREFLSDRAAQEQISFGKIDLHVWATAVKRPATSDAPAKPREPYGVAELFRQCLEEAATFRGRRWVAAGRLAWVLASTPNIFL